MFKLREAEEQRKIEQLEKRVKEKNEKRLAQQRQIDQLQATVKKWTEDSLQFHTELNQSFQPPRQYGNQSQVYFDYFATKLAKNVENKMNLNN